ncbi:MAG TPA: DUF507 family protein [Verrucomicrobiae bacterium]|jgi:hypothetical protein|nr:DUF507 family protein [Verrucomicrobiae bacterium]
MTHLTESRISHLAHLIIDGVWKNDLADFPNESRALAETKRVLQEFFGGEDRLDDVVRQKIQSLSRRVAPGSREWDVLYRKYMEEELRKQR